MTKLKDIYPLFKSSGFGSNIIYFADGLGNKISNEHISLTDYEILKDVNVICVFNQLPITIKLDCSFKELGIKEKRQ